MRKFSILPLYFEYFSVHFYCLTDNYYNLENYSKTIIARISLVTYLLYIHLPLRLSFTIIIISRSEWTPRIRIV